MSVTRYNSNFSDCFPFSNTAVNMLLAASTEKTWTVPGDASQVYRAHFSTGADDDVWIRLNATAVVPISDTVTSTPYQERIDINFNRYVKGGDVIHIISLGTPEVGISLQLVQDN